MRKIDPSQLARMLREGFDGEVHFSGSVRCRLRNDAEQKSLDSEISPLFFRANGNLSLQRIGRDHRVEEGSYSLAYEGGEFYFKPKEEEKIESNHHEKYGDVIAFRIDFPVKATLQIEPENILY